MTDTAPDSMTARGMMRLLVLAACLCTGTRRVTAQLTEDTPIGAGGGAGSFYFFDNAWDVPPGTRGECVGKDCQQYACTNRPEQPYCRGCSGMGGEGIGVWNVDPQDCLEDADDDRKKCSTCKMQCKPFTTGWEETNPVAGAPSEPWSCKSTGKSCRGRPAVCVHTRMHVRVCVCVCE